jgi:hypothetical protein
MSPPVGYRNLTPVQLFMLKVRVGPGCWEWQGTRMHNGYGQVGRGKPFGRLPAHRWAFYLAHGRMPEGDACHSCDNRLCVRPSHIFEGTRSDNMRDAARKGRLGVQKDPAQLARWHRALAASRGRP